TASYFLGTCKTPAIGHSELSQILFHNFSISLTQPSSPLFYLLSFLLTPTSTIVTVTSSETLTHIGDDHLSTSISHSLSSLSTTMPRDGVSVLKVGIMPRLCWCREKGSWKTSRIGSFKKANNMYEDRILEGRPSLEKSQIDFSDMDGRLSCFKWQCSLGTKLLTFSLNSSVLQE
ncbi:Copper transport protein CCH, partial [Prunus dulcis]